MFPYAGASPVGQLDPPADKQNDLLILARNTLALWFHGLVPPPRTDRLLWSSGHVSPVSPVSSSLMFPGLQLSDLSCIFLGTLACVNVLVHGPTRFILKVFKVHPFFTPVPYFFFFH